MNPKLDNLDVNMSANEIGGYIDWFNFWIDTRETSVDNAIKGGFSHGGWNGMIYLNENVGIP